MQPMQPDPVIDEVREVRHRISAHSVMIRPDLLRIT